MQLASAPTEETIEVPVEEYRRLRAENEQHRVELRLLSEQVAYLKHQLFGTKRERLVEHPELFEKQAEPAAVEPERETKVAAHSRKGRHPGRNPFPEHLPREVVNIPVAEEEKTCSQCGSEKAELPPEITRELERVPAKVFVKEYHRQKCACRACGSEITTAPAPSRPIEKGIAGPGLLAQVVVDKFADHIPLYRQEQRFKRERLPLSRQTLCGWLPQLDQYTRRIVEVMKRDLVEGGYIQADETPIPVQDRRKRGRNHQGYLWPYGRPDGPVVFDFRMSRSREGPMGFLKGFRGILQHDGYEVYLYVDGVLVHVACMAHIRRKFWDAQQLGEKRAVKVVRAIDRLFRIERIAREKQMNPEARYALRQKRAVKRMELLKLRIQRLMLEVLPKSKAGKACGYALGQWPHMVNYLTDGRIEISNNLCENSVRPVAIGRKNWMHIGSEAAGPVAANFMSLVETCKRCGVDPLAYFTDIFARIAEHPVNRIAELTPSNWAQARRASMA
jgi:transposase